MKKSILLNFIIFYVLCIALALPSCISTQKAISVLEKRQELPKVCHDKFPVDSQVKITSDTVVKHDTVTQKFTTIDTVKAGDTVRITTHKVDVQTVTKYIHDTKTITKKDSAEAKVLLNKIDSLNVKLSQEKAETEKANKKVESVTKDYKAVRSTKRWYFWIIVALALFILRKPIKFLIDTYINIHMPFKSLFKK